MRIEQPDTELSSERSGTKRVVARVGRSKNRAFCILCNRYVKLLTPKETEEIYKANWVEVVRLTESGRVHRIHNAAGAIRICYESLSQLDTGSKKRRVVKLAPISE